MSRPSRDLNPAAVSDALASGRRARAGQVEVTRQRILVTAERLFAEHGVFSVSNRQISEAAGQGNNTAVGYHFGTKEDLIRALVRRHTVPMAAIGRRLSDRYESSTDLRDWVTCVVRPFTDHLASLGSPSWYARFAAQVLAEPRLRELAAAELGEASMLRDVAASLHRCLPTLAAEVLRERDDMARTLIVHVCAQRERSLGSSTGAAAAWAATATSLIDVIVGMYLAPVSSPG
ncbi:TetR/AcrR family transcriptional regulator [Micromonospora echinospora]|uniref:TetR/AcrR family transcriptional regulator n=1 Tax=Micromonospora echinospora TaxID=1877 RepID=UPI0037A7A845